jgi:hypothetical protein
LRGGGAELEGARSARSALALAVLVPVAVVAAGYVAIVQDFFLSDDFSLLANAREASSWAEATDLRARWNRQFHRPAVLASWWLATALFGLEPLWHHLVNVALHALNACLVARLATRLGAGA